MSTVDPNTRYLNALQALSPEQLAGMYLRLKLQVVDPPEGWWTFGTHLHFAGELEFWGTGEDLLPLWERPKIIPPTGRPSQEVVG